ncbi:adenylate/guanylate cyclase domain-containing protein [Candidatus Nitrospira allomarina]|uniref:Adenylate/guanylate cyclase domain-containing protein n=1 Tax=Candidatus Nitrospira allomarina TaxID=3020900 RepID=A0AA96JSI8_9BACT|nr:adenylate/guanylate cyclase domain-containing protein [Candidatus Nitrospira allomarina]WNM58617.1 adenylate/guanylate cyclase domain-containing protein [Candidatus Nitrospira allomarina]
MRCYSCSTNNPDHLDVCSKCGVCLENRCAACGIANSPQGQFCRSCGNRLAERRQLTVLFCDLVGSTTLAERLGTEEWDLVLRAYYERCREIVDRNEGHVAHYLGDGVLVYFGHPHAQEDDAQRAIRTALAIRMEVKKLKFGFQKEGALELSVRMGIDTGEVIVGHDEMAVGETLNIAARVQTLADPDTIVMTAATHRLVEPYFTCQGLGTHSLKGLARQVQLYRVEGETEVQTRMQAAATLGIVPLVGRDKEANFLWECWQRTCSGNGQVVLVRGEPGIGKSRLIEVLKCHLAGETFSLLECYCLAYDQHTAFAPLSHLLRRTIGFKREDSPQEKLSKLRKAMEGLGLVPEDAIPLLAPLVSLTPDVGYTPRNVTPLRARQLTLETLTTWLLRSTETAPVLFIVEDLHWIDPSSLELLDHLMNQQRLPRMLMLLTYRPEFQAKWPANEGLHSLDLTRLTQEQTVELATHVAHGRTLPDEVLQEMVKRTDGVPLFVEELTKTILESGFLKPVDGSYELSGPLPARAIPTTVQDSLMARLDRLGSAKTLAQLGATIGRDFRHDVLQSLVERSAMDMERDLARLIESNLVTRDGVPPLATYSFRHALIQETAYNSLLQSTRVRHHERIARVLVERFPEVAENQPELLAQHFSSAGCARQAATYWKKAGSRAMERLANKEATGHFTAGLDLLPQLPEDLLRISLELELRLQLGLSITASDGYAVPRVGEAYQRARELCFLLGNNAELYPVLRNLCSFYIVRDDLNNARELAEECLRLGQETHRDDYLIEGYTILGYVLTYMGDLEKGTALLDKAMKEYRSCNGKRLKYPTPQEPGVASLCLLALNRWMLGDYSEGSRCNQEAIELAEELNRPFDIAYAHCFAAMFHNLRCEFGSAGRHAEVTIDISQRHDFFAWLSWGTMQRAIAMGRQGGGKKAIDQLTDTLAAWQAGGGEIATSYFLGGLADVYRAAGRVEDALNTVEKAIDHAMRHDEHWYESVLYRMRGELLGLRGTSTAGGAEDDFSRAVEIARVQGAKLLELQAALRLHVLCLGKGRPEPSFAVLKAAFKSLPPDALDIPDLQEARALLDGGRGLS